MSMEFIFKNKPHKYKLFFGEKEPSSQLGEIGDLFHSSSEPTDAYHHFNVQEGKRLGKTERIFFKTSTGWKEMQYNREGVNHTPSTKHPTFKGNYCLDDFFCAWKSKTWYTTPRGKTTINNVLSQEPIEEVTSNIRSA